MKIKQSFTKKTDDITIKQVIEIAGLSRLSISDTLEVILNPDVLSDSSVWLSVANVLKINLSDIYEVEQLPNTHYEIL